MNKQQITWQLIVASLDHKIPVVLLYVMESKDSSPGRNGFFMVVTGDGQMSGSIGGGIMEHKFVELAKDQIRRKVGGSLIINQVHDKKSINQSGMICSGEQTVLLYSVQPSDQSAVIKIIQCLSENRRGQVHLSCSGINFSETIEQEYYHYKDQHDWKYSKTIGFSDTVYIIGGGHCSLALSALLNTLDFFITVFDDRDDLHTMTLNEHAHKLIVVKNYEELDKIIPEGDNVYVVVMTFGYRSDDIALRALMYKEFKYLGVLGSHAKITKMFSLYKEEGISKNVLEKIQAPVGISIHSQTPEEIAVSIAAEMISVRREIS